uniref:Uncharacterized protein n=1 Tax=Eutreptiella gymnastica TaxID=73025 RepID=A0A7S1NK25_9EUGL
MPPKPPTSVLTPQTGKHLCPNGFCCIHVQVSALVWQLAVLWWHTGVVTHTLRTIAQSGCMLWLGRRGQWAHNSASERVRAITRLWVVWPRTSSKQLCHAAQRLPSPPLLALPAHLALDTQ